MMLEKIFWLVQIREAAAYDAINAFVISYDSYERPMIDWHSHIFFA